MGKYLTRWVSIMVLVLPHLTWGGDEHHHGHPMPIMPDMFNSIGTSGDGDGVSDSADAAGGDSGGDSGGGSGGRGAYSPPTANGVVRPGGTRSYSPPTANGVVRPGGDRPYSPPTANGVVRP